jgi:hypothetical protein
VTECSCRGVGLVASQKLGGEAGVVAEPAVVDGMVKCDIRRRSERGR